VKLSPYLFDDKRLVFQSSYTMMSDILDKTIRTCRQ